MALNDFFSINLPYGIRGNKNKGWMAFNREYKPLGFSEISKQYSYEDSPYYAKYKGLTEKRIQELSDNDRARVQSAKDNDDTIIFLYKVVPKSSTDWDRYLKKIQILLSLKIAYK